MSSAAWFAVRFALSLICAGVIGIVVKKFNRKRKRADAKDEHTHWI